MTNQPQKAQSENSRGGIKWFLLIPVVLCICGAVTFFLRAQDSKKLAAGTSALDTEPVTLTHAQQGAPSSGITLPSTLQGFSDSPVYARTSGYVGHWYADIGTHVHQENCWRRSNHLRSTRS
jgi:multidrug efflux pump subunit AcrA (membrane-fusion protein)